MKITKIVGTIFVITFLTIILIFSKLLKNETFGFTYDKFDKKSEIIKIIPTPLSDVKEVRTNDNKHAIGIFKLDDNSITNFKKELKQMQAKDVKYKSLPNDFLPKNFKDILKSKNTYIGEKENYVFIINGNNIYYYKK